MKRGKIIFIMTLFMLCILPINVDALNIANVKSSTNYGFNEGGDYYYLNWKGTGDKTFSDKYIVYDLGDKYTLTLTIKSAYVNYNTWSSEADLNSSCPDNLGEGYLGTNYPCLSIKDKPTGRLVAIKKNSVSIHMWGIKQLNVEYELKYDNKSMSEDDIKERIGEINVKLIDVDNQQAIRIDSGYSNISYDNNILKGCRYDSDPNYQDPIDKNYYKYFNKKNCNEQKVSKNRFQSNETNTTNKRGWIKFKSSKSKIKLAFFSGQKKWYSFYQEKYKYEHAYFEFETGNIETTGKIKIQKYLKKTDRTLTTTPIQGAGFKYCKGDCKSCTNSSTWKSIGTTKRNGVVTSDYLPAGKYCVYESTVPTGYQATDSDRKKEVTVSGGSVATITFYNKQLTEEENCEMKLSKIKGVTYDSTTPDGKINIYKFDNPTNQTLIELIKLYNEYNEFNDLLMFDKKKVACSMTTIESTWDNTCDTNLSFSIKKDKAKTAHVFGDYDSPINRNASYGKNSLWGGITSGSGFTYCYVKEFSINSSLIKTGVKIPNGQAVWKSDDGNVAQGNLTIECYNYIPKDVSEKNKNKKDANGNVKWIYNNWGYVNAGIEGLVEEIKKIKLTLGDLGDVYPIVEAPKDGFDGYCSNDYTNASEKLASSYDKYCIKGWRSEPLGDAAIWEKIYEINFNFKYPEKLKYIKQTGALIIGSTGLPYIESGYGFPTEMGMIGNFQQQFSVELPDGALKTYFNDKNIGSASCGYTTTPELIGCPTGDSECSKQLNLAFRIIDTENPFPGINGTGRTTGSNWSGKELEITSAKANNSYNKSKKDPLISIRLTPTNIEAISSKYNGYNKDHSYDDFELDCTEGKECTSSFVTRLLNGDFGAVEGSCDKGSSRKYCVGES